MTTDERNALIQQYAEGYDILLEAWNEVPPELRKRRPDETTWSAHENIVHCADSEMVSATRIRFLISEPNAIIAGYDQDEWVDIFRYHDRDIDVSLDAIRAARSYTVPVLRAMPDAAWSATGSHTQSGRYSATDWLNIYANHLHGHAEQIRDNLRRFRENPG